MSIRKKDEKSKPLARITLKFWPLLLALSFVFASLSVPAMVRLYKNLSTDPVDLLPADHPNVRTLLEIRKKVETRTRLAILLESERPEGTRTYLLGLVRRLEEEPFVGRIQYRKVGYDFFDRHKLLFIELKDLRTIRDRIDRRIQEEKLGALFIDLEGEEEFDFGDLDKKYRGEYADGGKGPYFSSPDERIYALYVESKEEGTALASASRFYDQTADFLKGQDPTSFEPSLKVHLSGPSKVLEYRALLRDLKLAGVISGIAIFLPLLIRFRNPIAVLLIFAPLALGIPIAFALSSFFIQKLSVTTAFLFAILGGLGIETGIHLFSRYDNARRGGKSMEASLQELYSIAARSILTSVASVAVTFLLLMVNEFRGFSEFGLIAGVGLWILFFLYLFALPPLLILAERLRLLRFREKIPGIPKGFQPSPMRVRATLIALGLFSLFSFLSPFRIGFEYSSKKIRADLPEIRVAKEKQRATQTRVNSPAVVLVSSEEEAALLKQIFEERKAGDHATPTIDTTRSYYDLVPRDQTEKLAVIREIQKMLSDPTIKLVKGDQKKDLDRFKKALDETAPPLLRPRSPRRPKRSLQETRKFPGPSSSSTPSPRWSWMTEETPSSLPRMSPGSKLTRRFTVPRATRPSSALSSKRCSATFRGS